MAFADMALSFAQSYGRTFTIRRVVQGEYVNGAVSETVMNTTVQAIKRNAGTFQTPQGLVIRERASLFIPARQTDGSTVARPDTNDKILDPLYGGEFAVGKVDAIDVEGGEIAYMVEFAA